MKKIKTKQGTFNVPENYSEITFEQCANFTAIQDDGMGATNGRIAAVLGVEPERLLTLELEDSYELIKAVVPFSQQKLAHNPAPFFEFGGKEYRYNLKTVRHIIEIESVRLSKNLTDSQRVAKITAIAFNPYSDEARFAEGMTEVEGILWQLPAQTVYDCYFFFALTNQGGLKALRPYLVLQTMTAIANLTKSINEAQSGRIWERFLKMPRAVALRCARYSMNLWLRRLHFGITN